MSLDFTQILLLAVGAIALLFFKSPSGGWIELIRNMFRGEPSVGILTKMIEEFYKCGECTPEEEKKIEEALSIIVSHFVRHRVRSGPETVESKLDAAIERRLKALDLGEAK